MWVWVLLLSWSVKHICICAPVCPMWVVYDIHVCPMWVVYDIHICSMWVVYDVRVCPIWDVYDIRVCSMWVVCDKRVCPMWVVCDIRVCSFIAIRACSWLTKALWYFCNHRKCCSNDLMSDIRS